MQQSDELYRCNSPKWCTAITQDVNVQAGQLKHWQQEYNQLSDGAFHGAMIHTDLGPFHLFQENTSQALQQFCRVPEDAIWLGFSAQPQYVSINQQKAEGNTIMVRPGGIDFELATGRNSSLFGVVIAPASLPGQHEIPLTQFAHTLTSSETLAFQRYIAMLFTQRRTRWRSATHQQLLYDALISLLPSAGKGSQSTLCRNSALSAVKEYLNQVDDEAIVSVAGLANIACVSPRALHRIFCDHYGVSPVRFLQARRLNQVRRALQHNGDKRCIADIAFDHGFYHLSQFSKQYRRLFEELPSETQLHQHHLSM